MDRLTRPDIDADQAAVRFMETEVKIQDIGELLGLILNGPTINSIKKDTLRHIVRQLYTELKRYEDTGLTPEQIASMRADRDALLVTLKHYAPCEDCGHWDMENDICMGRPNCVCGEAWEWRGAKDTNVPSKEG